MAEYVVNDRTGQVHAADCPRVKVIASVSPWDPAKAHLTPGVYADKICLHGRLPVAPATAAEPVCACPPCPGRGNDGHGLTHCAECCFGTGVEADVDCPIHGRRAAEPGGLREAVEALASAKPDGDDVVRVTISPIPGVGVGQVTRAYVSQSRLRAVLAAVTEGGTDV